MGAGNWPGLGIHGLVASYDGFDAHASEPTDADCIDASEGFAVVGHSFGGWTTLATSGAQIDLAGLNAHCETGYAHLCGLVGLDGLGHYSFAYPCLDPNDGCGEDFLDDETAQQQISALTVAFLDEQLGSETWGKPDWAGIVWEEVR